MKDKKKQSKEYTKPIVISVGLHALLVAALLWGTDFAMTKPEPTGQMVQAVVIDPKLVQQQAKEIRQQREKAAKKEQDRLDKLRREAEQLEKNRKAEEEQIRKLKEQQAKDAKAAREAEAARKQKEQERKAEEEERVRQEKERTAKLEKERKAKEEAVRKAEQERLAKEAAIAKAEQERVAHEKAAKEAEEKAKREREAAQKAEQERIAKEKAAKEAAEKARKEKERLERERKEQEAALDDIFAGLESEASANQQAQGKFVADEVSRYSSIYIQLIQSRLLKDDYLLGKECRVNIKLIPTGTDMIVSSVNVLSGDSRVCAAAKSAIAQVPSFPMSTDSTVNQRLKDINLTVALQQ
ncbi:cell envelope integrity protein TolA [Vibrio parahaemolyticus]|uniref:cell envelope integrity protein TolA n=1 Tax=Vibrio parahaemolyticus TaxID=670 RepID=UPI0004E7A908|nr:cell envelope integrity protein TolA [Vibrio parahaemolyticus]AWG84432.1 biopolymer transporter TolR [Vibrio parahaemolyticus]KFE95719.1 biopolymer transporter TolR [Vibrio parahaemolyticus]MBE4095124.1 cell envelope integrity protein TolA [Vibrio parahaemolyticus]MBE4130297.1 cell envelope integrity protein TolA [Vibrio parahaemolyticus]MBX5339643.1 cell envelope integrity protein TolA [Vibrio parahaemolyticus]